MKLYQVFAIMVVSLALGACTQSAAPETAAPTEAQTETAKPEEAANPEDTAKPEETKETAAETSKPESTSAAKTQDAAEISAPETFEDSPEWVGGLKEAEDAEQLFVVAGIGRTTAYISMHEKDADGNWKQVITTPGYIGKYGLGKEKEGDAKSPVGTFHFNYAFGIAPDPGCALEYHQVDDDSYWSGDQREGYRYNEMVSIKDFPDLNVDDSEHIVDYINQYQYCLNISYNEEGTPGLGSAIFLHCLGPIKPYTGGCVAIPEDKMIKVMQNVKENCVVVIGSMEELIPELWEEFGLSSETEPADADQAADENQAADTSSVKGSGLGLIRDREQLTSSEGCETWTQMVDWTLGDGQGYANVKLGDADVLLVSDNTFSNGGAENAVGAEVFGYADDGSIVYLGYVKSGGSATPIAVKDGMLYVSGHHYICKITVTDGKLVVVEEAWETFDKDGNGTFHYSSDDGGDYTDFDPEEAEKIFQSLGDECFNAEFVVFSTVKR